MAFRQRLPISYLPPRLHDQIMSMDGPLGQTTLQVFHGVIARAVTSLQGAGDAGSTSATGAKISRKLKRKTASRSIEFRSFWSTIRFWKRSKRVRTPILRTKTSQRQYLVCILEKARSCRRIHRTKTSQRQYLVCLSQHFVLQAKLLLIFEKWCRRSNLLTWINEYTK